MMKNSLNDGQNLIKKGTITMNKHISIQTKTSPKPNAVRFENLYHSLQSFAIKLQQLSEAMNLFKTKKSTTCYYPVAYSTLLKALIKDYQALHNCSEQKAYNHLKKEGLNQLSKEFHAFALSPLFSNRLPKHIAKEQFQKSILIQVLLGNHYLTQYPSFPFEETGLSEALEKDLEDYHEFKQLLKTRKKNKVKIN